MASPATTSRSTPGGIKLKDGYQSLIAFALDPDVSFWEKEVQPSGLDSGGGIDANSMHNTLYRMMRAKSLISTPDITTLVSYDPNVYNNIISNLIKQEGSVTVQFADGSTVDFFGFLDKFIPAVMREGEEPEATITIVQTNYDPANNVEAGPVLTSVVGT